MGQDDIYKYDIAFSFTQNDEQIAFSLYSLLKDRVKCFIYSEEQKRLAGKDGETEFNKVFSKEARIVAILSSGDWGETQWTRIEKVAINNKAFSSGYDFVIFIPTKQGVKPPEWLPKNRLWVGLERWGIENAASILETRIQEFGGEVKETSIADKFIKLNLDINSRAETEKKLNSLEGVQMMDSEYKFLIEEINEFVNKLKESGWQIKLFENKMQGINIWSYSHCLTLQYYGSYSNSTKDSYIMFTITDAYYNEELILTNSFSPQKLLIVIKKKFDINEFEQNGWSEIETGKNFETTYILANKILERFFDIIQKHRTKTKNNLIIYG